MVSRIFNWVSYQKQRINWVERLIRNGNNGHGIQNDRNSRSHTCKVFVLNIVWAYMSLCLVLSPCLYWAYTAENIRIDAIHTSIISITEHHLQEQNFLVVQHYGLHYTSTERDPQQSIQLKADPFYLGSTIGIHACWDLMAFMSTQLQPKNSYI